LKKDKNSRRFFIKALGVGIGTACLGMWGSMVNVQQKNTGKKTISISLNDNREVIFHEDCIIINNAQPLVFSSYCTHLGCRIQNFENGQLICPCHGSVFDLNGNPQKGPSIKPLRELEFTLNPETKTIIVNV
jgi:Rieske Fe-S protein